MIARTCLVDDAAVRRICKDCGSRSVKDGYGYLRFIVHQGQDVVCEVIDEVAFYCGYFGKSHFRLVELAVEKGSQRGGYGSVALRRIVDACRERRIDRITFRCSESEGFAGFYLQHGAMITGRKDGDYEMELALEDYIG